MISYTVKHHTPGRIRIEIPEIKKLSPESLGRLADVLTRVWRIEGIRDFNANPFTGSATIKYNPEAIEILSYLSNVAADKEIEAVISRGGRRAVP